MRQRWGEYILFCFAVACLIMLGSFTLAHCQPAPPVVVIATPFTAISTVLNSAVVPNSGQVQHLIKVEFPTAKGTVSGINVILQGSYDNGAWFQFSTAITSVTSLTGSPAFYSFVTAYGSFPYVRVRSSIATPGGLPMTVRYLGYAFPSPNIVTLLIDRFAF